MSTQSSQLPKTRQPTTAIQSRRASGRLAKNTASTAEDDDITDITDITEIASTAVGQLAINTKRRRTGEALIGPLEMGSDEASPYPQIQNASMHINDDERNPNTIPHTQHGAGTHRQVPPPQEIADMDPGPVNHQGEPDDDEVEIHMRSKKRRTDDGKKDPMAMEEDTISSIPVTPPSPYAEWQANAMPDMTYSRRISITPSGAAQRSVSPPILSPPPPDKGKGRSLGESSHAPMQQNTDEDRAAVTKLLLRLRRNNQVAAEAQSPVKKEEPVPPQPTVLTIPRELRPRIIGRYTAHLLENINWVDVAQWMDAGSPYVLLTVLGHGNFSPHILAEIASELLVAIREYTGSTTVSVFAPSAATDTYKMNLPPFTFVARDISTTDRDKLIDSHILNCRRISFVCHVTSFNPETHVGSIDGYNVNPEDEYRRTGIVNFVKDLMMTHVGGVLADMLLSDVGLAELNPIDRAHAVIKNLTVSPITISFPNKPNEPGRTVWNIILEQPDIFDEDWIELQKMITTIRWNSPQYGPGVSHAGWTCHYCHSTTHPTGLCPFLGIEGWRPSIPIQSITNFARVYDVVGKITFNMSAEDLNGEARRIRTSSSSTRGTNTRGRARGSTPRGAPYSGRGRGSTNPTMGYVE